MRGAFCCAAGGGAESFQGMRDDEGRGRMGPAYAPHGRRVSLCGPAGGDLREQGTVPETAQGGRPFAASLIHASVPVRKADRSPAEYTQINFPLQGQI